MLVGNYDSVTTEFLLPFFIGNNSLFHLCLVNCGLLGRSCVRRVHCCRLSREYVCTVSIDVNETKVLKKRCITLEKF